MKHTLTKITIGFVSLFFLFGMFNGVWAAEKKDQKANIAMVNGKPIDKADFNREMKKLDKRAEQTGQKPSAEERKKFEDEVIDRLITMEVLYQESEKKGIKVDPKNIDNQYDMFAKRYPDKEKFKAFMNEWDVTEDKIKSEIKRGVAIQELIKTQVTDKIAVPEKEVKKFYDENTDKFKAPEQVKASHILIKLDPKKATDAQKAEAKKKLEAAKERLKKGEDFAAVAKEISEGPSKKSGGDLGFFGRGQMVKPFEDAAFALKAGDVSDIVETQFGYHLIKVFEKKPAKVISFDEVKERLANQLKQQRAQQEVMAYVKKLKDSAKVERLN